MNKCLQPAFNQKKIEKQQIKIVLMKGAFILKVFFSPIQKSNYFLIMNIRSGRFIAVFMYNYQNHLLPTNFIKERTRVALRGSDNQKRGGAYIPATLLIVGPSIHAKLVQERIRKRPFVSAKIKKRCQLKCCNFNLSINVVYKRT